MSIHHDGKSAVRGFSFRPVFSGIWVVFSCCKHEAVKLGFFRSNPLLPINSLSIDPDVATCITIVSLHLPT